VQKDCLSDGNVACYPDLAARLYLANVNAAGFCIRMFLLGIVIRKKSIAPCTRKERFYSAAMAP